MDDQLSVQDGKIPIPKGVFPLNWEANSPASHNNYNELNVEDGSDDPIYPDLNVWKQTEEEDIIMKSHLQKGYMEQQYVKHEDQSGRQVLTTLINRSNNLVNSNQQTETKLNLLSQIFIDSMHKRKIFNTIKTKNSFKPPPRVTLTEHKKDIWLKKLSNPNITLNELSRAIPHGLRNKYLLEQCLSHRIPIPRSIWLIKCVSTNEQRQLKRKNVNSSTNVNKWIVEWSEQITSFFESIIESYFINGADSNSKFRLNYSIELITNLYSSDLMNKITFLTWIVKYTSHIVNNCKSFIDLKPILIHQYIIKLFWFKIIKFDYLIKELSESMLLIIIKSSQLSKSSVKFEKISFKIIESIQYLIKYLFYYNSDIFIIPSNWNTFKPYLKKILDINLPLVNEQFELIAYRNESLRINEFDSNSNTNINFYNDKMWLILNKLNNSENETFLSLSKLIFEDSTPTISNLNDISNSNWKNYLNYLFQWSIQKISDNQINTERILLICSILQFRINHLLQTKSKKYKQFKIDLENKIIDFIYMMSEILNVENIQNINVNPQGNFYDLNNFLLLINKLYSINLFIISSYLRRLIASGVIYLSEPDRTCYIHILILNSLPNIKDFNFKSILKRLTDSTNFFINDNNEMLTLKETNNRLIDELFNNDNDDAEYSIDNRFIFNGDPIKIRRLIEIDGFIINKIENNLKNKTLQLTYNKLLRFYKLFGIKLDGLNRLFLMIFNSLNSSNGLSNLKFTNMETLSLFLKLFFLNFKNLKNSLYKLNLNVYDYCINILNEWILSDMFQINTVIKYSQLPRIHLKNFPNLKAVTPHENENVYLTPIELNTLLEISTYERLTNGAEFIHYATFAITKYSNFVRLKTVKNEDTKLVIKFLKSLKNWKLDEFNKFLNDYLVKFLKPIFELDYEFNLRLLKFLIVDEFINLHEVIKLFEINKNNNNNHNFSIQLYFDLLFTEEDNGDGSNLEETYRINLLFKIIKNNYILDYSEEYYKIFSKIIFLPFPKIENENAPSTSTANTDELVETFSSLTSNNNNSNNNLDGDRILNNQVIRTFWELVLNYNQIFIDNFYISYDTKQHVDIKLLRKFILTKILHIKGVNGGDNNKSKVEMVGAEYWINEDISILESLRYFNLPILQWIFTYNIQEQFEMGVDFHLLINKISTVILNNDRKFKLIGELFIYLPDYIKKDILLKCEEIYLNSETFPKVIYNGNNITNLLSYIISSVSRLKSDKEGKEILEMNDGIVFSLNSSIEKLISLCNEISIHKDKWKDLELGIKMISRIILLHKYFLVELIFKRSINLQRDILLINLLKIFNHKIMIKYIKLKNLLYDVLISLKVIISEHLMEQIQKNISMVNTGGSPINNNSMWINKGITTNNNSNGINPNTSNNNTFFSPINSPKPNGYKPVNNSTNTNTPSINIMPNILNIKPPSFNNNLRNLLSMFDLKDTIVERENKLFLVNKPWNGKVSEEESLIRFVSKPFEEIEDSCMQKAANDCSINVELFGMSVKRENIR